MKVDILNPWWKGKQHIQEDKHLKELEKKTYKWEPELLKNIRLSPNNIFSLRGPRQIGKTTLVKLLIKDLLKRVDEKAVFFWNCDETTDFRELSLVLREFIEFSKINQVKEKYIFLDEVSRVKDWQRSIKSLEDSGELNDCCVFITGSHVLDIKHGMERLPGRTGKEGKDYLLLPMTFRDFITLLNPEIVKKLKKISRVSIKEINDKIESAKPFDSELEILFKQYLITGGFPLVINEFFTSKNVPDYVYELYSKWITGDIVKWGKQEKILMQLLRSVITKQSSAISWDSLAKDSEIKSHKTVSSYVEVLENMFVLLTLYFFELDKKMPNFDKNKKLYFSDPFIYHVFNKKLYFKENEVTPELVEATVISNLSRLSYEQLPPSIYYWKNKKEVDAVLKIKNDVIPFEIKYQAKISKQDYKGLYYFKKGILVTKNFLNKRDKYPAVPAHLLLSII